MQLAILAARTVVNTSDTLILFSNFVPEMESLPASLRDGMSCVGTGFMNGNSFPSQDSRQSCKVLLSQN